MLVFEEVAKEREPNVWKVRARLQGGIMNRTQLKFAPRRALGLETLKKNKGDRKSDRQRHLPFLSTNIAPIISQAYRKKIFFFLPLSGLGLRRW